MALTPCRHCETPNPDTARFCSTCGEPVAPPAISPQPSVPSLSPSLSGTRTTSTPPSASQPGAGEPFGTRYRLLQQLGKGGMGEVWKARDVELDQLVALKMIRPELLEEADLVERFKQEITLARKVTHKNVTRIYDLGEVEGTRFISMEYLEGLNLKEFIRQEGPLPEEKAIPIIRGICEGLKAAHDAGVVHRDLKPQNILIDPNGQAHIMDFGIAFSGETSGLTRTGALIGTPEYMSPEQVRGERLDVRSDIYSLGLIFYEMVTRDLPFTSDSVASSMYKRLSEKPRRPREVMKNIPPFLEKIILRCLEKERSFRYGDVGEILEDIQQKQARVLSRGHVASLLRRKAAMAAGILLLGGLAITVVALFQKGILNVSRESVPAAGAPVTSVAVFPFENTTGDAKSAWIRSGLANLLTTDLAQAPGIRVVSSARLTQILHDLRLADLPAFDAATLQKVAGFLDAQRVLAGSFVYLGGRIRVDAQLFRIRGKEVVQEAVLKAEAGGEQELFTLVDDLARQVRGKMGATPGQIQAERPREVKQVTTASVPALREYTGALDRLHRGSYLEAVEGFKRAVEIDPGFAVAHARLGEALNSLGRETEAIQSLDTAASHLDRASVREAFIIKALRASLKHDNETAIRNYEDLVKRYPNDPEFYFNLAAICEKASQYDKAVDNYRKALASDEKYAAAFYGLGKVQLYQADLDGALKSFTSDLSIQDALKNEEGKATALNGLGAVYYEMGRDTEAVQYYRQSADIKKTLEDFTGYANSMNNIAQAYRRSGKFDEAIQANRQALENAQKIGNRSSECAYLESLGTIYYDAGRFGESLKAHQESLRIARAIGDERLAADNLGNIGAVHLAQGRYTDAEVYYQQALETRRKIGSKDGIMRSLVDLGTLNFVEGSPDKAMQYYLEGMQIARESHDQGGVNEISINLGELYVEQGHYKSAAATFEEVLEEMKSGGDQTTVATALKDSGDLMGRLGRFPEADGRLAEAEKIAREVRNEVLLSDILSARGEMMLRQGNLAAAGESLRKAAELSSRQKDQAALLRARIGLALQGSLSGGAAGSKELDAIVRDAEGLGNVPLLLAARVALARAELRAGRKARAAEEAGKVITRESGLNGGENFFQAFLIRGLARTGEAKGDAAAGDLLEALRTFEKIRSEMTDPSAFRTLLGRADLRSDLKDLSKGFRQAEKNAESDMVAAWLR